MSVREYSLSRRTKTLLIVAVVLAGLAAYWLLDLGQVLSLASLRHGRDALLTGTRVAGLERVSDLMSLPVIGSILLLALFPLLVRWPMARLRKRKLYARWPRPRRFDSNLVVIGAGAAGLVASYIGAALKAKVTLIESDKMGGDCLNTGCVPSKALLRSAKLAHQARHARIYGLTPAELAQDFAQTMERVQRVVRRVEPHDSAERFRSLGVDVVEGRARIVSPWMVEIETPDGRRSVTTRGIVIATGASAVVPPIPGIEDVGYRTSDTLWSMRELPRRLVVLGGGPIGCELVQAFARLGAFVTVVEMGERLLPREDADAAEFVARALAADGVQLLVGHEAVRCEREGETSRIVVRHAGAERHIEFDELLCAVGRAPRVEGFGLEELGIEVGPQKTLLTDASLRTRFPNIVACGDVAGPYQFTHVASHQAWYAAVNALFGGFKRLRADYSVVPWTTFTDPEVARVGLSEDEARQQGIAFELTRYGLDDLDRAIADGADHGFVKVLTVPAKDRILGATIVGEHAGDLLAEFVLAMRHGIGLNKILHTIHTYPTLAEANRYAAAEWRRTHAPPRLLAWLERFHAWRRHERRHESAPASRSAST
jgi:pyruvate/2-oxoglutarate dehydrogenase complex dihydrolipoamide dehydrogenase (E3) component